MLRPALELGTPCNLNLDMHESNLTASVFSVVSPVVEVYFGGASDDQLQLSCIKDRYQPGIDHLRNRKGTGMA